MFRDYARRLSVALAAGVIAAACADTTSVPRMRVRLQAPPNDALAVSRNVTFQWRMENRPAQVNCVLHTDKGQNPFDGNFEESFSAGDVEQITVDLDQTRYSGVTIEWGVICHGTQSDTRRLTLP